VASLIEQQEGISALASAALREKACRALGGLPPFSPILNRLLASLAGEDVSFAELGQLIEKDTVLSGNILHLVNSALYSRGTTVTSVRRAVSVLGINKLRNAVLGMSVTRLWGNVRPAASWSMARFNMHAAATAMVCDLLVQIVPVQYPEGAFVAGLMHDVGRLLMAVGLPDDYERVLEHHRHQHQPISVSERALLGFTHAELSEIALAHWKLARPIQEAVREHHLPAQFAPGEPIPLGCIVSAADAYVDSLGISVLQGGEEQIEAIEAPPLEVLGVGPAALAALRDEFQGEFEAMRPFFR